MKKGIHPENYRPVVFKDMSNGDVYYFIVIIFFTCLVNNIGCNGPFWTAKILLFFEIEKTSGCFFF